jgi:hypothetical protein
VITSSHPIAGGDFAAAGCASRGLKDRLRRIGVEAETMRRVMIAAYEAEMNVVIHARRGNLWARFDDRRLELEIVDEGPGIADVAQAMKPGFSTASAEVGPATRSRSAASPAGAPPFEPRYFCARSFETEDSVPRCAWTASAASGA